MSTEPGAVGQVICKQCGNETPPGPVCSVCNRPLPRSIRSNRFVVLLAMAIAILALGVLLAALGASGTAPS